MNRRGFLGTILASFLPKQLVPKKVASKPKVIRDKELSKEEWMALDAAVIRATRDRLRMWADGTPNERRAT